jgi:uncharacterized protein YndB with AHSA1/START domain
MGQVMRAYEASVFIDGPPERVWPVLTDVAGWPAWDSGVTAVDGQMALGRKLTIRIKANPGRAFPVKVIALDAPSRIVLRGGMPFGLFTGERTYTISPDGSGTRFTMREEYTGPLAGIVFKSIPDLAPSFRRFAEGLRQRVTE